MRTYRDDYRKQQPRYWAEYGIHPGAWFVDVFPGLGDEEKVAWIDLLALAVASFPSGRVGFCSEKQIARILNIDEPAFSTVLKTAGERWMAEVSNKAVVPYYVDETDGREFEIPDESKYGIRYKELAFPGIYTYFWTGPATVAGIQSKHNRPDSRAEKETWDAALKEPREILAKILEKALSDKYSPGLTLESPICLWSKRTLPKYTHFVPDPFDVEAIISNYKGLALWRRDTQFLRRTLLSAWVDLENWIRETVETPKYDKDPRALMI